MSASIDSRHRACYAENLKAIPLLRRARSENKPEVRNRLGFGSDNSPHFPNSALWMNKGDHCGGRSGEATTEAHAPQMPLQGVRMYAHG
jgi:hypothetical protein